MIKTRALRLSPIRKCIFNRHVGICIVNDECVWHTKFCSSNESHMCKCTQYHLNKQILSAITSLTCTIRACTVPLFKGSLGLNEKKNQETRSSRLLLYILSLNCINNRDDNGPRYSISRREFFYYGMWMRKFVPHEDVNKEEFSPTGKRDGDGGLFPVGTR